MEELTRQVQALSHAVAQLTVTVNAQQTQLNQIAEAGQVRPQLPPVQILVEPKMPLPEKFSGLSSDFSNFRNRCCSYFQVRATSSGTEMQRVSLLKTLLQGDSQTWAYGLPPDHEALQSVQAFFEAMAVIYDDPDAAATAVRKLRKLCQGKGTAEAYAAEFRRWSVSSKWGPAALLDQYLLGLSDPVNDALVSHPEPRSLEDAISLSIRVDRRLRHRQQNRARPLHVAPVPDPPYTSQCQEEPMQLGQTRLSTLERRRRLQEGLCLYCGQKGHVVQNCKNRSGNSFA